MKPDAGQIDFIEAVGRWWESIVGSRVGGRILGWLMICDPPHQSSTELAEKLAVSTGSVSTQVRTLEILGLIERTSFPGDRATYFQFKPNAWVELMWAEQQRIKEMLDLTKAGSGVLPVARPDRVTQLRDVASFFVAEWPGLMERLTDYLEREEGED